MSDHLYKNLLLFIFLVPFVSCSGVHGQVKNLKPPKSKEFNEYWYSGEAELTRYELEQARYGEIHKGDAVLIFVTEDFNTNKQVKYEQGDRKNVESVMKLNFTRKFFTGIYPYSMMSSIFTPVNQARSTYKVTTSSQEWCGHTYSQLNLRNHKYEGLLHSYFQDEGDQEFILDVAMLEDEIWNKIRLNPSELPLGDIKLIPGAMFLRLKHQQNGVKNAIATSHEFKDATLSTKKLTKYRIEYKDIKRVLEITFESAFPFSIVAWEEQVQSGFGSTNMLTTRAKRTHSIKSAYWGQHDNSDSPLKKQLGLDLSNY